jgi:hypothetical protein
VEGLADGMVVPVGAGAGGEAHQGHGHPGRPGGPITGT